ncbi:MAG: hypothetical protein P1U46_01530 [Patescibacteria group bacterium]|nr:hypothetical protein [Patescibacteria group bacterium]
MEFQILFVFIHSTFIHIAKITSERFFKTHILFSTKSFISTIRYSSFSQSI